MKLEFKDAAIRLSNVRFSQERKDKLLLFFQKLYDRLQFICEMRITPNITQSFKFTSSHELMISHNTLTFGWVTLNYLDAKRKETLSQLDKDSSLGCTISVRFSNLTYLSTTEDTLKYSVVIELSNKIHMITFDVDFHAKNLDQSLDLLITKTVEFINDFVDNIIYDINNNWKIDE